MRIWLGILLTLTVVPALANEVKSEIEPQSTKKADLVNETEFVNKTVIGETMTIWIDVRTAEEFSQGHIPGSINIPYEIIGSEIASVTRDVDKDIRVYCRSGRRSGVAMDTLRGMGYENVINEGGYEDLLQRKARGEAIP
jgi:phage shock protein E